MTRSRLQWPNMLAIPSACAAMLSCGVAGEVPPVYEQAAPDLAVESSTNSCPNFAFLLVLPKVIRSGEVAVVAARATDVDTDDAELTYAWSATSGEFLEPAADFTEYYCADSGPQVLSVVASDPEGCEGYLSFAIECLGDGAP